MSRSIGRTVDQDKLISRLFFSMLPVQMLLFAMGYINTIVDGTIAGRFIGSRPWESSVCPSR